jgi:hypothetical protein
VALCLISQPMARCLVSTGCPGFRKGPTPSGRFKGVKSAELTPLMRTSVWRPGRPRTGGVQPRRHTFKAEIPTSSWLKTSASHAARRLSSCLSSRPGLQRSTRANRDCPFALDLITTGLRLYLLANIANHTPSPALCHALTCTFLAGLLQVERRSPKRRAGLHGR